MRFVFTVMCLGLAAALPAQAQKVAPGLWEYSTTMKTSSGEMEAAQARMQQQMASMTPEQRKMMENMMSQRGVSMGAGPGQPTVIKTCVSAEMAAREEMPQHDSRCKQVSKQRSGNTMKFKFECTGEHASSGEGEYTFVSDKEMKGKMNIVSTVKGKAQAMQIENSGRWLGADCGSIKPPTLPPGK